MSSNTNNLRAIIEAVKFDPLKDSREMITTDEAIAAVLALLPEKHYG